MGGLRFARAPWCGLTGCPRPGRANSGGPRVPAGAVATEAATRPPRTNLATVAKPPADQRARAASGPQSARTSTPRPDAWRAASPASGGTSRPTSVPLTPTACSSHRERRQAPLRRPSGSRPPGGPRRSAGRVVAKPRPPPAPPSGQRLAPRTAPQPRLRRASSSRGGPGLALALDQE